MSEALDLKNLYSILAREIENDSLQYIERNTYREIAKALGNLKGTGYDGLEAKVKTSLSKSIANMASMLLFTRLEKIKKSAKVDYSNLTEEEEYVFSSQKDLTLRFEEARSAILEGRVKVLESIGKKTKIAPVLLRFLKSSQTLGTPNSRKYGPFEAEDVAVLPYEIAKQLVQQGLATELPEPD